MSRQCLETFPRSDIPNPDTFIERPRHDQVRLRIEVAAEHVVAVALQRLQTFAGTEFPDFQGFVIGSGNQKSRIARPENK